MYKYTYLYIYIYIRLGLVGLHRHDPGVPQPLLGPEKRGDFAQCQHAQR